LRSTVGLEDGDEVERLVPWAKALGSPDRAFYMNISAVPRDGMSIQRKYKVARDAKGGRFLWLAREKTPRSIREHVPTPKFDGVK